MSRIEGDGNLRKNPRSISARSLSGAALSFVPDIVLLNAICRRLNPGTAEV